MLKKLVTSFLNRCGRLVPLIDIGKFSSKVTISKSKYFVGGTRPPKLTLRMFKHHHTPKLTICVEGNIGSGKTTLLNHLSKLDSVQVFQEPVDKWRDVKGLNLLDLMYKDPYRWAHVFQSYVQLTMIQHHLTPTNADIKLIERSIYSARHCFVENLYQSGTMSQAEYNVYNEWYEMITSNMDTKIDLIIYLRTKPEVVYERIKDRSRSEEQTIPIEYLRSLHDLHEKWLSTDPISLGASVIVIDADDDLDVMTKKFNECAEELVSRSEIKSSQHYSTTISPSKVAKVN